MTVSRVTTNKEVDSIGLNFQDAFSARVHASWDLGTYQVSRESHGHGGSVH